MNKTDMKHIEIPKNTKFMKLVQVRNFYLPF